MIKNIVIIVMFVCGFSVVISSCAKKEKPATPFERMIGKWKKVKYGTDDNNNGKIEASEISSVQSGFDNELFFKSDGSGVETTVVNKEASIPLTYNWYIKDNDSVVMAYDANYTATYYLDEVSSHDLSLLTVTQQGLVWYYYVKL